MLNINFQQCCHSCPNRKTYARDEVLYSDGKVFEMITVIGCEHETVCGKYLDESRKGI